MWKTTLKYKNLLSLTSNILGSYMQVFTSAREFNAEPTHAIFWDVTWFIEIDLFIEWL